MDAFFEAAVTDEVANGETLYQHRVEKSDQRCAKTPPLEYHVVIQISSLMDDVRKALEIDRPAAARTAARLAALLASKCSDASSAGTARGGLAPWQQRKVRHFIEEGLDAALPIEGLAKLVSLSPSYFCRAFKETFGEPPHAYIIKRRVERAKRLMLNTAESLSQIALACGLADQAHFCRCFRQIMGTTPSIWRRSHASEQSFSGCANAAPEKPFGMDWALTHYGNAAAA
jgi:AraC-like DNA-binding protein